MKKQGLSPHVDIYKFPVTAISSITNRLSGLYWSGLFIGYGVSQLVGVDTDKHYKDLSGYKKSIVDISLLLPMTYHTFGGVRHLVWDKYPSLLTNSQVSKSSYLLFGVSLGTSILTERYLNSTDKQV